MLEDLDPWTEMMADEETGRFIGGIMPRAVVFRLLATMVGHWYLKGYGMFSVIEKESGLWVGRLGPWNPEGWPGQEVGWGLSRASWGKGYGSEGATAAIDWAFERLGWEDMIHCIHPDNANSINLATRLGSTYRGHAKLPAPLDLPVLNYGQTREEWRARRR
jgi:RimJ/RimL family protein N-acetyltransferase